jgi:hypothetical protein
MVWTLEKLPKDHFASIADYLSAYDLYILWSSGNKRLCALMSVAITHFMLTYDHIIPNFPNNLVWPQLLSCFPKLEHVYFNSYPLTIIVRRMDLNLLPRQLKTLHLSLANAMAEMLHFEGDIATFVALNDIFPNLEVLSLSPGLLYPFTASTRDFVFRLPPRLRSLTVGPPFFFSGVDIELLPETLESCSITMAHPSTWLTFAIRFPPGLTKLSVLNFATVQLFPSLPRSLIKLSLLTGDMIYSVHEMSPLPQDLKELSCCIYKLDSSILAALPRGLISFDFTAQHVDHDLNVSLLPPGLTHLGTMHMTQTTLSEASPGAAIALPRSLTHLPRNGTFFPPSEVAHLPRGLKEELVILKVTNATKEQILSIPPMLSVLNVGPLRPSLIWFLPKTLRMLVVDVPMNGIQTFLKPLTVLKNITSIVLFIRPPFLIRQQRVQQQQQQQKQQQEGQSTNTNNTTESTSYNSMTSSPSSPPPPPPSFVDLSNIALPLLRSIIIRTHVPIHHLLFGSICKTCPALARISLQSQDPSANPPLTFEDSDMIAWFREQLPPTLTDIDLRFIGAKEIPDDVLPLLPPKLMSLTLGLQSISVEKLIQIPAKSLTHLELHCDTPIQASVEDLIRFLPRKMIALRLPIAPLITPANIAPLFQHCPLMRGMTFFHGQPMGSDSFFDYERDGVKLKLQGADPPAQ